MPLAWIGHTYFIDLAYGWSDNALETLDLAKKAADKVLELNPSLDMGHATSGFVLLFMREYDKALEAGEKAVTLNPNGAHAHVCLAYIYWMCGKSSEAVVLMEKAFRLNPIPLPMYYSGSAMAYRFNMEYDKAIEMALKAIAKQPGMLMSHLVLTASYSEVGKIDNAKVAAKEVIKIDPEFSLEHYAAMLPYKLKEDIDRYINALRKAGLPD